MRLVLASASPRRADLLRAAGFEFETLAVNIDEAVQSTEPPDGYVRRLASGKSAAALNRMAAGGRLSGDEEPVILGADTVVVVDGEIFGKPVDDRDAASMLRKLSGRAHEVMTGLSLRRGTVEVGEVCTTTVWFDGLSPGDIEWYVASGEGRDKAGSYAIQGLASRFVSRIDGSYSNVVGLPVAAVYQLMREFGTKR
jgi:septum formation protein